MSLRRNVVIGILAKKCMLYSFVDISKSVLVYYFQWWDEVMDIFNVVWYLPVSMLSCSQPHKHTQAPTHTNTHTHTHRPAQTNAHRTNEHRPVSIHFVLHWNCSVTNPLSFAFSLGYSKNLGWLSFHLQCIFLYVVCCIVCYACLIGGCIILFSSSFVFGMFSRLYENALLCFHIVIDSLSLLLL